MNQPGRSNPDVVRIARAGRNIAAPKDFGPNFLAPPSGAPTLADEEAMLRGITPSHLAHCLEDPAHARDMALMINRHPELVTEGIISKATFDQAGAILAS